MRFLLSILVLSIIVSCGDDDSSSALSSAATLTVDGVSYTKSTDSEIVVIEVTFNEVTTYAMGGDMVNGTDTISFSVNIPSLSEQTYTKSANGDEAT
ncbi:MAG: hypothetical protein HRT61_23035, partial [Ekhidna sp.]|nr:hypothetical protein [Ekhidna sp.]